MMTNDQAACVIMRDLTVPHVQPNLRVRSSVECGRHAGGL